jgi:dynein heavy chain
VSRGVVREVQRKLSELQDEFEFAEQERAAVVEQVRDCELRLTLALRLTTALQDEGVRWNEEIQRVHDSRPFVLGDSLVACAVESYATAFALDHRRVLLQTHWYPAIQRTGTAISDIGLNPERFWVHTTEQNRWHIFGLPHDAASVVNACVLLHSERVCLVLDPESQCAPWLRRYYDHTSKGIVKSVKISNLVGSGFTTELIDAITTGCILLVDITGTSSLNPLLLRLIQRRFTVRAGRLWLSIANNTYEINPMFRCFLITHDLDLAVIAECASEVSIVNFTITPEALEAQLLSITVQHELGDVEEKLIAADAAVNEQRQSLESLENLLIHRLATLSTEELLRVDVVEGTEQLKAQSITIASRIEESLHTRQVLLQQREVFRELAARGSLMYFVIRELIAVESLYAYSLQSFTGVYKSVITSGPAFEAAQKIVTTHQARVSKGGDTSGNEQPQADRVTLISLAIIMTIQRGLLLRHRLVLIFAIALRCLEVKGTVLPAQVGYLLQDATTLGFTTPTALMLQPPVAPWITKAQWRDVAVLVETVPGFGHLAAELATSAKRWQQWTETERPEEARLPGDWKAVSVIAHIILVKVFRPDRFRHAAEGLVSKVLGPAFVESSTAAQADVGEIITAMAPSTPLLYLLFVGADPIGELEQASRRLGAHRFANVALGEGQGPAALLAIQNAMKSGGWVVLQNLHLMTKWLPTLEAFLDRTLPLAGAQKLSTAAATGDGAASSAMRLFFTAEATNDPERQLPTRLVQRCLKLAMELPIGLRASMARSLQSFAPETIESNAKASDLRTLVFNLAFLHTALVGRRQFGRIGWSKVYPFSSADLAISFDLLRSHLDQSAGFIPWAALRYLIGEIIYGGLITDTFDRRVNTVYVQRAINEEALVPGFELAPGVVVPAAGSIQQLQAATESLNESVEAFGLHDSAAFTSAVATSAQLATDVSLLLIATQANALGEHGVGAAPSASSSGLPAADALFVDLAEDFIATLSPFDTAALKSQAAESLTPAVPLTVIIAQDSARLHALVTKVLSTLRELVNIARGRQSTTDVADRARACIDASHVPPEWQALAYPSVRTVRGWIDDLAQRTSAMEKFVALNGEPPKVLWLGAFFSPSSVITTLLQSYARKHGVGLDSLAIDTEVLKKNAADITHAVKDTLQISGIFLEGAAWDLRTNALTDCSPRASVVALPVVSIRAVPVDSLQTRGLYWCPLYATRRRGDSFVCMVYLRTTEPQTKWILRGTCALLDDASEIATR